jgi:hypothetical protein
LLTIKNREGPGYCASNKETSFQFSEVEKSVVNDLYERIKEVPRHTGFVTMLNESVEKSVFDKWYMASRNVGDFEGDDKDVLLELFRVDLDRKISGHVRLIELLLEAFRQRSLR